LLAELRARFDELTAPPTPALAVEIASGRAAAARMDSGQVRAASRPLPASAVTASAVKANLNDAHAVALQLRALLESMGGLGAEVTLLVPDLTARVSVLDFDLLPGRADELRALAHFRLRKSLPFADEQMVLSCQRLSPTRLLVAFADRARLAEYEDCLEAAGARAAIVLPSGLACLAALPALHHGALLLRAEPGCLTSAFAWNGQPEFFRALELGAAATFDDAFPSVAFFRDRVENAPLGPATADTPWRLVTSGLAPELETRLADETPWATLQRAESTENLAVTGAVRGRFA